jgi:hypothetical protein
MSAPELRRRVAGGQSGKEENGMSTQAAQQLQVEDALEQGRARIRRYSRQTAIYALVILLISCLWGLLPPALVADRKTFVSTHHMGTHQAELLLGLSWAWTLLSPRVSARAMWWLHVSTVVAAWGNPAGYALVALTGQGTDLLVLAGKDAVARGFWSHISTGTLMLVVTPANILGFSAWLYLLWKSRTLEASSGATALAATARAAA